MSRETDKHFSDKVVLVTGASSGLGQACALHLGKLGARVVINYRSNEKDARATQQEIKDHGGEALVVQGDVSQEKEVLGLFKETVKRYGRVDVVVSNAGLQVDVPFVEMELDQWQKVIDVNLTGQFLACREAARQFLKQAEGKKSKGAIGNIIMMSSVHDIIPWAGHINYAASKGGVLMLMKSIAQELAPQKIRVNAVSPGAIKTAINEEVWSDAKKHKELLELIPYRRIGTPQDVAKAVAWLASDDSDYVNGETIYIDGGMTLYPEFADNG
jgi:glucose 1-dehydrogenase